MFVIKRSGAQEPLYTGKITDRIIEVANNLKNVDPGLLTIKVSSVLKTGMTTSEIDSLIAETAEFLSTIDPNYSTFAGNIYRSDLHKRTPASFSECLNALYFNKDENGNNIPLISENVYAFALKHLKQIESVIDFKYDYKFSYSALKILETSYLLKSSSTLKIIERPQCMFMRVALGIHYKNSIEDVIETYRGLATFKFIHASPTLFNSGTNKPAFSSCFLLNCDDSIEGIGDTGCKILKISKMAGGIGVGISNVRAKGSLIKGTNGQAKGIVPLVKLLEGNTAYANQGGKRKGSMVCYLEIWHADILGFLKLRLDSTPEEMKCADVHIGLWLCDIFMERVKSDSMFPLFCPDKVKGLTTSYGEDFRKIFLKAEEEKKYNKLIPAKELMKLITEAQLLKGEPYILFKDRCNELSNQKNIGVIQNSNLCAEILEVSSPNRTAVCNLASLVLSSYSKGETIESYDYEGLMNSVRILTRNLNRIIDNGFLATECAKAANNEQRAIGIGINSLQEVLFHYNLCWDSPETKILNKTIAEAIYYAALDESANIAVKEGSYSFFEGSPISKGIFHWEMANGSVSGKFDWEALRVKVKQGVRNSLLIAYMPTASTANIIGGTECFECINSNIAMKSVLAGNFITVNKDLVEDLHSHSLWTTDIQQKIVMNNGSIQNIEEIPMKFKNIHRTVWEYSQKVFCDLAIDRLPFIDQTQSFNVHIQNPTIGALSSLMMYQWEKGAKTGSYYIRSKAAVNPIKIKSKQEPLFCTKDNPDCLACSG